MPVKPKDIKSYKALRKFYQKDEPPIEVVMDQLHLDSENAVELAEYVRHPPKRMDKPAPVPSSVIDTPPIFSPVPTIKKDKLLAILRWPMLFLGIGAFFLSCHFAIDALSKRQPIWIAWIMAAVLIGFGLMSAELAVYYKLQKKKTWWVFALTWLLILFYSINTTTSSFYDRWNARAASIDVLVSGNEASRALLDSYDRQINDNGILAQDKRIRLTTFQATIKKYDDATLVKGTEYNNATWGAISLEKELKTLQGAIEKATAAKQQLLIENPDVKRDVKKEKPSDYYVWVSGIFRRFGVNADTLQFVVDLIPALVLDLISSLSLYVFLFLGKKPIDIKEEKK
jgi:hypothetical protein